MLREMQMMIFQKINLSPFANTQRLVYILTQI